MTAHLVMPEGPPDDAFLQHATEALHEHFDIGHVTLQVMRVPFMAPCVPLTPACAGTPPEQPPGAHDHGRR